MNATKVIALLLDMASLALLLFFGFVAFVGPTLPGQSIVRPWPLSELSAGCLGFVLFCAAAPLAAVPGLAGLALWWFVIRKQEAAADREAMSGPEREAVLQDRLDGLTGRLLEQRGDVSALTAEIPIWTRDLEDTQKNRLFRFLAECGGDNLGWKTGPALATDGESETGPLEWWIRAVSLGLLGFAVFCFLWGVFVAFAYLTSDLGKMVGLGSAPADAATGSGGCFVVGLAALLAGLALRWLMRREARRGRYLAAARQRRREITLDSCLRRVESLLAGKDGGASPADTTTLRIARAHVICALPELDGTGKGRLIVWLHAGAFLSQLALTGADLRGAILTRADLPTAVLAGANLSSARLCGARLVQADLRACRLQGADLRDADAATANLRDADLRQARMHRCNLRQADLRGAKLEGANLWQADLEGAQIEGIQRLEGVREIRP